MVRVCGGMPFKCKCCFVKGSKADHCSALSTLAFYYNQHPGHFPSTRYKVSGDWALRDERSSFKDLCKECRECAGESAGTDEESSAVPIKHPSTIGKINFAKPPPHGTAPVLPQLLRSISVHM